MVALSVPILFVGTVRCPKNLLLRSLDLDWQSCLDYWRVLLLAILLMVSSRSFCHIIYWKCIGWTSQMIKDQNTCVLHGVIILITFVWWCIYLFLHWTSQCIYWFVVMNTQKWDLFLLVDGVIARLPPFTNFVHGRDAKCNLVTFWQRATRAQRWQIHCGLIRDEVCFDLRW